MEALRSDRTRRLRPGPNLETLSNSLRLSFKSAFDAPVNVSIAEMLSVVAHSVAFAQLVSIRGTAHTAVHPSF